MRFNRADEAPKGFKNVFETNSSGKKCTYLRCSKTAFDPLTKKNIQCSCTGNSLTIPNISFPGSVSVTGNVTGANITTLTYKVTALETKTTGISYSSGTTTIDSVPKIGSESLIDLIYPVGTVYQSSDASFNPNTKWEVHG